MKTLNQVILRPINRIAIAARAFDVSVRGRGREEGKRETKDEPSNLQDPRKLSELKRMTTHHRRVAPQSSSTTLEQLRRVWKRERKMRRRRVE